MTSILNTGLDIETVPAQNQDFIDEIKFMASKATASPGQKTKEEMGNDLPEIDPKAIKGMSAAGVKELWIAKMSPLAVAEEFEKLYRQTSFSAAEGGEIVSIAAMPYGFNAEGVKYANTATVKYRHKGGVSEIDIIKPFVDYIDKMDEWAKSQKKSLRFVGANIYGFDIKFICQRCMILGIDLPKFGMYASAYDKNKYFDVLDAWNLGDRQAKRVSVDKLCKILGIPTPKGDEIGPIHGGMVWDIWDNGGEAGAERIAKYNARDVVNLEPVFNRVVQILGDK